MPSILCIPESLHSDSLRVQLSKEGLVIDCRVIDWDDEGWEFTCVTQRTTLTVTRIDKIKGRCKGWHEEIRFRMYDPTIETVPLPECSCARVLPEDLTGASYSKSYRYHGLEYEKPPFDAEEVMIDPSVTIIQPRAFMGCRKLKRCVLLSDNIKRIEMEAFAGCCVMTQIIGLSRCKSLSFIGEYAFASCRSLDVVILPPATSTSESTHNHMEIQREAFSGCHNMRVLFLPATMDLRYVGDDLVQGCTALLAPTIDNIVQYDGYPASSASNDQVHHWLQHRYDHLPAHTLCMDPNVTADAIRTFVSEHGTAPFYENDLNADFGTHTCTHRGAIRGGIMMTPLHFVVSNRADNDHDHKILDTILACYDANPSALFVQDFKGLTPLDYLWINNGDVHHNAENIVEIIVHIIHDLCINRLLKNQSTNDEVEPAHHVDGLAFSSDDDNEKKRRRGRWPGPEIGGIVGPVRRVMKEFIRRLILSCVDLNHIRLLFS